MKQLQMPTNTTHVELWRHRLPQDQANNEMVEDALRLDAEYILFIDDDTQPPPSVILDLMRVLEQSDPDVMACGGIYTTKTTPPEPLVYMGPGEGSHWRWKVGEVFPCWAVGNGCLMVRCEAFRMMPKPWFKIITTLEGLKEHRDLFPEVDSNPPATVEISTDIFFFTRLAQAGFRTMAHGGVLPLHWGADGNSYWIPADSYPCQGIEVNGQQFGWTKPETAVA